MADTAFNQADMQKAATAQMQAGPFPQGYLGFHGAHAQQVRSCIVGDLIRHRDGWDAAFIVRQARILADFILGTNDAEVLAAARDLAAKVQR